jgi:hypothetical protein
MARNQVRTRSANSLNPFKHSLTSPSRTNSGPTRQTQQQGGVIDRCRCYGHFGGKEPFFRRSGYKRTGDCPLAGALELLDCGYDAPAYDSSIGYTMRFSFSSRCLIFLSSFELIYLLLLALNFGLILIYLLLLSVLRLFLPLQLITNQRSRT